MNVQRPPARANRADELLLPNEIALTVVTLAAVVGMHRLFVDGSYWWPLVLQVVAAHTVVAVLRRLGLGLVTAGVTTAAVAVVFITWTRFPDTTHWLLPTGDTLSQAGVDLRTAWDLFGDVRAPAPVENGFLAATAAAIWVLVYVADWAAFRVSVTFEALLPATTLFVFAAALGGEGSPVASAAAFSGAALMYALLHRTSNQERSSRWAGGHRVQGRWSLVGTGATIVGVAVVAGAVAGPNLPGADADALLAWRDINQNEPARVVYSPIVELRTKLVDQPEVEVFKVTTTRPSYWRMTALDEFDGSIWKSSYSTDDADGPLPRTLDTAAEGETVRQTFEISALSSVWLPAAFEPVSIDSGEFETDYDQESSTLMVDREVETSDTYVYTVESVLADWSADELRAAAAEVPDEIVDAYTALPGNFPGTVEELAEEITANAATPYDKALALQDYLRSDLFTYNKEVGEGHNQDALITFLRNTRRGYCEQFAASFAAMARYLGLPARVAVGFTWGINNEPAEPNLYRVRAKHAHAWPEVYIGEYGWVPFEPTPGRGQPRAENWLGIQPGQDTTSGGSADPEAGREDGLGSGDGSGDLATSGDDQRLPDGGLGNVTDAGGSTATDEPALLPQPIRDSARPVGVAVLAYLVIVPLAIVVQRHFRRRRATTPAARARYLWRETMDQAQTSGVRLPAYMTIAERATRLSEVIPQHAPSIHALAHTLEATAYGEVPPSRDEVDRAEEAWAAIRSELHRRRSWRARVGSYLDARRLFAARRERLVAHQGIESIEPTGRVGDLGTRLHA
jgi:transglutaminase-like putative cysteine protease